LSETLWVQIKNTYIKKRGEIIFQFLQCNSAASPTGIKKIIYGMNKFDSSAHFLRKSSVVHPIQEIIVASRRRRAFWKPGVNVKN